MTMSGIMIGRASSSRANDAMIPQASGSTPGGYRRIERKRANLGRNPPSKPGASSRAILLFEHGLFAKPVPTVPDQALAG
jgi:hypothetical protein